MDLQLPDAIVTYLTAAQGDEAASIARAFAKDAVVRDEGRTIKGIEAIAAWRAETRRKYSFTAEPLSAVERDGKLVVTTKVTGNFPGSPINLDYAFTLSDGRITGLEIA